MISSISNQLKDWQYECWSFTARFGQFTHRFTSIDYSTSANSGWIWSSCLGRKLVRWRSVRTLSWLVSGCSANLRYNTELRRDRYLLAHQQSRGWSGSHQMYIRRRAYHLLNSLAKRGKMRTIAMDPQYNNNGVQLLRAFDNHYMNTPHHATTLHRLRNYFADPRPSSESTAGSHMQELQQALAYYNSIAVQLNYPLLTDADVLAGLMRKRPNSASFFPYWSKHEVLAALNACASPGINGQPPDVHVPRPTATINEFFEAGNMVLDSYQEEHAIRDRTHQPDRPRPGAAFNVEKDKPRKTLSDICAFFLTDRGCTNPNCTRSHNENDAKEAGVCLSFLRRKCTRGETCRYSHIDLSKGKTTNAPRRPDTNSAGKRSYAKSSSKMQSMPCYDFLDGKCTKTDCKYAHYKHLKDRIQTRYDLKPSVNQVQHQQPSQPPPPPPPRQQTEIVTSEIVEKVMDLVQKKYGNGGFHSF